jgi:hypothetical protein
MKKYVITEAQIQKLAFGQCCDFQGIVDDVHTHPVEDPCVDNGCPDKSIHPKKDCFGKYQGVGDDRCFKCNDWGYCADVSEAVRVATEAENKRVLDEFKWMKPLCFGRHEALCDTRCAWVVRSRCCQSLRIPQEIKK